MESISKKFETLSQLDRDSLTTNEIRNNFTNLRKKMTNNCSLIELKYYESIYNLRGSLTAPINSDILLNPRSSMRHSSISLSPSPPRSLRSESLSSSPSKSFNPPTDQQDITPVPPVIPVNNAPNTAKKVKPVITLLDADDTFPGSNIKKVNNLPTIPSNPPSNTKPFEPIVSGVNNLTTPSKTLKSTPAPSTVAKQPTSSQPVVSQIPLSAKALAHLPSSNSSKGSSSNGDGSISSITMSNPDTNANASSASYRRQVLIAESQRQRELVKQLAEKKSASQQSDSSKNAGSTSKWKGLLGGTTRPQSSPRGAVSSKPEIKPSATPTKSVNNPPPPGVTPKKPIPSNPQPPIAANNASDSYFATPQSKPKAGTMTKEVSVSSIPTPQRIKPTSASNLAATTPGKLQTSNNSTPVAMKTVTSSNSLTSMDTATSQSAKLFALVSVGAPAQSQNQTPISSSKEVSGLIKKFEKPSSDQSSKVFKAPEPVSRKGLTVDPNDSVDSVTGEKKLSPKRIAENPFKMLVR